MGVRLALGGVMVGGGIGRVVVACARQDSLECPDLRVLAGVDRVSC